MSWVLNSIGKEGHFEVGTTICVTQRWKWIGRSWAKGARVQGEMLLDKMMGQVPQDLEHHAEGLRFSTGGIRASVGSEEDEL